MSMVIGTNVASLTAQRHLESSRQSMETSMERLASGKRINSAMDDSAGLAISSSLGSKISSMNQGIRNANDGISMLQTAEGALEETTSMLNRMKELATQSSSGSYTASDRIALNNEFQALATAITAIANNTDFNGTDVLNSNARVSFQVGDDASDTVSMKFQQMRAEDLAAFDVAGETSELADQAVTLALTASSKPVSTFTITTAPAEQVSSLSMDVSGKSYTQEFDGTKTITMNLLAAQITVDNEHINASSAGGTVLTLTSTTKGQGWTSTGLKVFNDTDQKIVGTTAYAESQVNSSNTLQAGSHTLGTAAGAVTNQTLSVSVNGTKYEQEFVLDATKTMKALVSQINDGTTNLTAVATSKIILTLTSTLKGAAITTDTLNVIGSGRGTASILTADSASKAITALADSITQVADYRSELGAVSNQLDHTVSNLLNRVENQSAAKSRIEDADFATESASLAKSQVLQQAGTAMLAQANASGQGVLSLLK